MTTVKEKDRRRTFTFGDKAYSWQKPVQLTWDLLFREFSVFCNACIFFIAVSSILDDVALATTNFFFADDSRIVPGIFIRFRKNFADPNAKTSNSARMFFSRN